MKKLLLFSILYFLFFTNCFSQSGWVWKSPYPQGNSINEIFTAPSGKLYGIGEYGTLITSTNGGANWNIVNKLLGLTESLYSHFVRDDNTIFIGASSGKLLKTTDAGLSWNVKYDFGQQWGQISEIDFHNINTGYIIAYDNYVFKTTNAGNNWLQVFNPGHMLTDIEFISPDTGFVSSAGMEIYVPGIYKTVNGGQNWSPVYSSIVGNVDDLKFINSTTGFATFQSSLLKTTNAGENWGYYGNNYYDSINTVFFFNDLTSYATFFPSKFKITTNGGYNWITKQSPANQFDGINFLNLNTGYLQGFYNEIYFTSNAGNNWTMQTESNGPGYGILNDGVFIDANTGFLVGMSQLIKRTTNQGENWQIIPCPQSGNNDGVDFINANTGFIVGSYPDSGVLLKSIDGGLNWAIIKNFANDATKCIRLFNENIGIIGFQHGAIYRTSDGGNNWSRVDSSIYYGVHSFFIQNSTTGYASGYINNLSGKVLKTTDAGLTWNVLLTSSGVGHIKFLNNNTGFSAGQGVLKTTDGGQNWFRVLNNGNVFGMDFVNENVGFVTGSTSGTLITEFIYRTTNGGVTWNGLDFPSAGTMYGVKFFNANTGLVFGEYSSILKTYDGGGNSISSVSILGKNIPGDFILSQNYPNPFNPSTKIRFNIPPLEGGQGGMIVLKVYDILGKEIATLVNEKLHPGEYEVPFSINQFSGYQLPSGIYFYTLTAGDFRETKKMLLIK